ncbi:MAG TPA: protein imuA [Caulobacteraceae bacterium]|nr:protein imuA [Caulobacteraceae bacterium]
MSSSRQAAIAAVRARIAALETPGAPRSAAAVLAFGDARVDASLPGGGLGPGRWHEFAGEGLELETAAAVAAFVARLAAPLAARGEMVWVMRRDDLHAPGLTGIGFAAERLIQVCAPGEAEALAVLEDALRTPGVAAAFGEVEAVDLTAGRRLQLACEQGAATGFILRRRPFGGEPRKTCAGSAAATRWGIAPCPSEPAPGEPGLGRPRWIARLERCRGGRTGAWIMEASEEVDAAHPFRVVAELADRGLATPAPLRRAG